MIVGKPLLKFVSRIGVCEKHSLILSLIKSPHLNKKRYLSQNILTKTNKIYFPFSSKSSFHNDSQVFVFNSIKEPQLLLLQMKYKEDQNIMVFQQKIKESTGVLEQMYIFKIFKVMQASEFNEQSYNQFFALINQNVRRKSDNMLLLLGTIKQRIAKNHQLNENYPTAMQLLQESLQILQECMVPQLLPYYSVYRQYGLLHYRMGNLQKAKQILTESVNVLDDFVSHSDDNVSTDHFCLKQATAYNVLAQIDKEKNKEWVGKALGCWQGYGGNKYNLTQYAVTVSHNLKTLLTQEKQKGEAYYHQNLFKFQTEEMKSLLKRAKSQASQQMKSK